MFTADRSLTVRYKLGEVGESEFLSHWNKIKQIHGASLPERMLWHPELFIGYVLPNYVGVAVLDFVRSLPGVESIARSKVYRSNSLSWGLDRIDQRNLPLNGVYSPDFNGTGVNVYIVDSGIDTEHKEFQPVKGKPRRRVENVFDASSPFISPNNDGVGHGTHVAGIVGGNTVGVSPGCNIFGVKVLASSGGGTDFDIIRGLSFVLNMYSIERRPSIVSMSLGGTCESYEECSKDLLVLAVEKLSSEGIVVVTAAGNSDCDSCLTTPAYAPQGITVGASSIKDDAAVFSDFGKCIDIYAPGVDIISACGSAMCPGQLNQYKNLSGTSMACPYVSGVVAQLLEGHPTSSVANITTMLSCAATSMVLSILQDRPPAVTRNLLVRVPKRRKTMKPTAQPTRSPSKPSLPTLPTTSSPTSSPAETPKPSSSSSSSSSPTETSKPSSSLSPTETPSSSSSSSSPTETSKPSSSLSPTETSKPSSSSSTSPTETSKPSSSSSTSPTETPKPLQPTSPSKKRILWGRQEDKVEEEEEERPEMCNLGEGCEQFNFCSQKGVCQNGRCLCDALAWGPDCSITEFGTHCDKVHIKQPYGVLILLLGSIVCVDNFASYYSAICPSNEWSQSQ